MTVSDCRFGFRIVGQTCEPRRLVDAGAAFAAHCAVDPRCEPDKECYLSAFWFNEDFRRHLEDNRGSTAGFLGPCWSPWLWFDIDADELGYAHKDAGGLAAFLVERYAVEPGELLTFFSGSKGFHVGLPTALWSPTPSLAFHRVCRRFAENVATLAAVTIDTGVYDRVRAFRAPNSRHPKTGLRKRRLSYDDLVGLPLERIVVLSRAPAPFTIPTPTRHSDQAATDWQAAIEQVARESEAKAQRRAAGNGSPTMNRATLDYIRHGADQGDRHRLLFSAAANLAEFGCPLALAEALLEESALDSGLPPKDIRRGIECGLATAGAEKTPLYLAVCAVPAAVKTAEPTPVADIPAALARLWGSTPTAKDADKTAVPPPLPEPSIPLPSSCSCDRRDWVDSPVAGGKTRTTCGKCGQFVGYRTGGPTR
jgi:hypothetical protein